MTLVFSGSEWVDKLCKKVIDDCRINKDRSPRGLAFVDRIELLKDKRIHHFKHEWLVLWLSYKNDHWILYLERSWDHESDEGWQAWVPPLIGERTVAGESGQQKSPEYDIAMFFKEGDEEERRERRRFAFSFFTLFFVLSCLSAEKPDTSDAGIFVREDESIDAGVVASEERSRKLADGCCGGEVTMFGEDVLIVRCRTQERKDKGWYWMGEWVLRKRNDVGSALR